MPRPKNVIPTVEKTVSLPQDLAVAVDLELFSEVEGKIPFGAWKGFLTRLVREYLEAGKRRTQFTQRLAAAADAAGKRDVDDLIVNEFAALGYHAAARMLQDYFAKERSK